ncbi:hypothetical protein KY290_035982 [Solanum tuberosum]|uniref:Reverse transcriptase domain-containing protein n=1 Tax=Solanum tuberosum TaxID=4113 RepID=A0ABQ7TRG6_SOLTU|nr:hypothetical protein KY290_035982 [Solanum tuberosum]
MEYLNRLFKGLGCDPDFNFHPRCGKLKIVQLGFADDLLLFCRAKGCAYFGGMDQVTQRSVLTKLQFTKGTLPFKYLGVPLRTKRISAIQCVPLLETVVSWINHWTSKLLSYVGRIQLIKSMLFSIQTFWAQIFVLPKKSVPVATPSHL